MAFEELKSKHSVVWGSGPYERISEHLKIAHDHLLREVEPRDGESWLDVATGTVKLKAQFRNQNSELFPNQFVNVRLKLETLEDQTVIAQSAVQRGGRGLFVYVVKDDMTVTARPVTLGPADGPRVAVLKGVEPGERVVVDGIDRLREGTRVVLAKRPEFKPPRESRPLSQRLLGQVAPAGGTQQDTEWIRERHPRG